MHSYFDFSCDLNSNFPYSLEKQLWLKQMKHVLTKSEYTLILRQFSLADLSSQLRKLPQEIHLSVPKNKISSLLTGGTQRGMFEGPILFLSFSNIATFLVAVSTISSLVSASQKDLKSSKNIDFIYGAFLKGEILNSQDVTELVTLLEKSPEGQPIYLDFFRCAPQPLSPKALVISFLNILGQIQKSKKIAATQTLLSGDLNTPTN
jgi:hypothetical protein